MKANRIKVITDFFIKKIEAIRHYLRITNEKISQNEGEIQTFLDKLKLRELLMLRESKL